MNDVVEVKPENPTRRPRQTKARAIGGVGESAGTVANPSRAIVKQEPPTCPTHVEKHKALGAEPRPRAVKNTHVPVESSQEPDSAEAVKSIVPTAPTQPEVTPMALLKMATMQGADLAKLEKLMELQFRWEDNQAKKAFVTAMNAFKAHPPEIQKNKGAAFQGRGSAVSYRYATLDNVCDQITSSLGEHGISHRWKVDQKDSMIRVTCILTHDMGHSEETTLEGHADETGAKNAIQAIGSTVTYLQRYTLLAATGLAVQNQDTDAISPMEGLSGFLDAITEAPTLSALEVEFKSSFALAMSAKNTQAMLAIVTAKDARKLELQREPGQ